MPIIAYSEKIVTLSVFICALAVGWATIHHGDLSLGLLVLLGQIQTLYRHGEDISHQVTHLAIHKSL